MTDRYVVEISVVFVLRGDEADAKRYAAEAADEIEHTDFISAGTPQYATTTSVHAEPHA